MTTFDALHLLQIVAPHIKASSQADADEKLAEWKAGPLKSAFRASCHATHPDKHPDDPQATQRFLQIKEAHEQLAGLRARWTPPPPPPPPPATACPRGHARVPETARFCHECGHRYDRSERPFARDYSFDFGREHSFDEELLRKLRETWRYSPPPGPPEDPDPEATEPGSARNRR